MAYDRNNVFARILRGELPCKKVYESKHALAFHDINPIAPVHVLVIPKGAYATLDEMTTQGTAEELADFLKAIGVGDETAALDAEGIEHHVSEATLAAIERLTRKFGAG